MKQPPRLSVIVQEEIKKGVGKALQKYSAVDINKRQEMEQQGVDISNFVFAEVMPVIENTKVDRLLVLMGEGIGNMVMLTPALKALRHTHPRLKITVWCKEPAAQVIRGWEVVDRVITECDNRYYDLCFTSIWGHGIEADNKQYLQSYVRTGLKAQPKTFHESIQQMSVAEFLGATTQLPAPHCQVAEGEEAGKVIDIMTTEWGPEPDHKYIIFGDTSLRNFGWDVKKWPYYDELATLINKKFPQYKIVMIGDDEDLEEAKEKDWPENTTLEFMGKLSIPQLAFLIKGCEIYIGNDTGPTHIAGAVGAKTYAIFAPTLVSKNKPLGKDVTILNKRPPCSPCQYTDKFSTCECLTNHSAMDIYNSVFFSEQVKTKTKTILVGDFSGGVLRNEMYIKRTLEKDFGHKVIPIDYRVLLKKQNPLNASYEIVNSIVHHEPDYAIICGGQTIVAGVLSYINSLSPKTKLVNWYVDNRDQAEPWFKALSAVCHSSYWSTGDPKLLAEVFSQTQRPCEFLPITADDKTFKPIDIEKTIDVLFVGTPHSPHRIQLLEFLVKNGVKIEIYGNGDWPESLKSHVKKGIFDKEFVKKLNQAKIVLNTNFINHTSLSFSDRYFQPMAVKTVGLNMYVPKIEYMFEDGKHMVLYKTPEECLKKINELLADDTKRQTISEEGYKLYKEKYTLKHMLSRIVENGS